MPYMDQSSTELIQQPHHVQILDANGNVTTSVPAYLTPDGRQVILQEIDPLPLVNTNTNTNSNMTNEYNGGMMSNHIDSTLSRQSYLPPQQPAAKSVIVSQKVAPSAYQTPNQSASSAFHSTNNASSSSSGGGIPTTTASNGNLSQLNRDILPPASNRLTTTSSAVNLSSSQVQKQQQQQQQQSTSSQQRDVGGSVSSLPGNYYL
jgi:hypothetical protein